MKILTVLARGVEGCGVTVNSIKFTEFVNKQKGYKAACVANTDIKWGRGNVHKGDIKLLSFTKQFDELKALVDEYDKIIFMCTPLKKSSAQIKKSFVDILDYAKSKKKTCAYCQFDHKIRSLRTNMYSDPEWYGIWKKFDVVFTHSHTNDFVVKYLEKNKIPHNRIVCRGDDGIVNLFAIDFEELKNKFWKKFEDKEPKTIKFIGRDSAWKGPWAFRDLHYNWLMKDGWIASAEGIGLSIGTLNDIFKQIKPSKIVRDDVNIDYIKASKKNVADIDAGNIKLEAGNPVYFMPPYNHDTAMERLSKCQFGIELLMLDDNFSKDVIENAMFEIAAVGCIPVFRKRWADNFKLVKNRTLGSYQFAETGMIFLDEENPKAAVELMNMLAKDKKKYDEARETAYNFMKTFFDVKPVYTKLLQEL